MQTPKRAGLASRIWASIADLGQHAVARLGQKTRARTWASKPSRGGARRRGPGPGPACQREAGQEDESEDLGQHAGSRRGKKTRARTWDSDACPSGFQKPSTWSKINFDFLGASRAGHGTAPAPPS